MKLRCAKKLCHFGSTLYFLTVYRFFLLEACILLCIQKHVVITYLFRHFYFRIVLYEMRFLLSSFVLVQVFADSESGVDSLGHGGTRPHFYTWLSTGGTMREEQLTSQTAQAS